MVINGSNLSPVPSSNYGYNVTNESDLLKSTFNVREFGAKGDGSTDDTAAIQAAINALEMGSGGILYFPFGNYIVSSTLNINYGFGYGQVSIYGNNSQIYFKGAGSCININPTTPRNSATPWQGDSHFEIHDLTMNTSSASGSVGIDIGASGYITDGFQFSIVENVMIQNFDIGIRITEARHIEFKSVVTRTCGTKGLYVNTTGNFVGDMNFISCEFTGGSHSAIHLYSYNGANNTKAELRGVHFTDTIVYGNGSGSTQPQTVMIEASGYGRLFDVWFTSCALDSGYNYAFNLSVQQNAYVGFFHFLDTYIVNFTYAFYFSNSSSVVNDEILIKGCKVGLVATPFNIYNVAHCKMIDNVFKDVTAQSTWSGACKNIQMLGNSFRGSANLNTYSVTLAAAVLSAIIKNNFGNFANGTGFVQNQTTLAATALVIADNLQTVA